MLAVRACWASSQVLPLYFRRRETGRGDFIYFLVCVCVFVCVLSGGGGGGGGGGG